MSIQEIFYVTYIIIGVLAIVLLLFLVVFSFYILKRMDAFLTKAEAKFDQISATVEQQVNAASRMMEQPGETAIELGSAFASGVFSSIARGALGLFSKKK